MRMPSPHRWHRDRRSRRRDRSQLLSKMLDIHRAGRLCCDRTRGGALENTPGLRYAVAVGGHQRGQSLIEFTLTVGAFLVVLFGAFSTALYAVQRSAAVTAAAAGARAAASAQPNSPNDADLAAAAPLVASRLSPVLFGTALSSRGAGGPCDPPGSIPPGQVQGVSTLHPVDPGMAV